MSTRIGVRLMKEARTGYFDLDDRMDYVPEVGDQVMVQIDEGIMMGVVSESLINCPCLKKNNVIGKVIRFATSEDLADYLDLQAETDEAFRVCRDLIDSHNLEMNLVSAYFPQDERKLIFYFTAEGRVDFRALVKDLAAYFRMRIELRQIGVRDDAKMNGGLGVCGRELCCTSWMNQFEPVSIRMAKQQNIAMNPTNVSGACGRLLCCLAYENETYKVNKKLLPKVGSSWNHQGVKVKVSQLDVLGLKLTVQPERPDGSLGDPYIIDAEEIGFGEAKRRDER